MAKPADSALPVSKKASFASEGQVGTRLKHARLTRGWTLEKLARTVECSVSAISKIENHKTNPSIPMLHKMCRALGTNMATLFATAPDQDSVVTRMQDRAVLTTDQLRSGTGISLERLIPPSPGYLLQGYVQIIEPGGYSDDTLQHEGEEVGYIVQGTLELNVNGKVFTAETGDSFFFRSDLPHSYRNPKPDTVTRVVWINTPPTF